MMTEEQEEVQRWWLWSGQGGGWMGLSPSSFVSRVVVSTQNKRKFNYIRLLLLQVDKNSVQVEPPTSCLDRGLSGTAKDLRHNAPADFCATKLQRLCLKVFHENQRIGKVIFSDFQFFVFQKPAKAWWWVCCFCWILSNIKITFLRAVSVPKPTRDLPQNGEGKPWENW